MKACYEEFIEKILINFGKFNQKLSKIEKGSLTKHYLFLLLQILCKLYGNRSRNKNIWSNLRRDQIYIYISANWIFHFINYMFSDTAKTIYFIWPKLLFTFAANFIEKTASYSTSVSIMTTVLINLENYL